MDPIRDNIPVEGPLGDGGYLIGGYDNQRTNAQIMLGAKATEYKVGTVLGKITATGVYVPLAPGAADGSQNFAAINFSYRPASPAAAQRGAGTVREATINSNFLYYENAVSAPQKAAIEAAMAAAGIIGGY
jgi:hypothetical protein